MKSPSLSAYLALFLAFPLFCFSQNNSLTTLPSSVYVSTNKTIVQSTEDSENHKMLLAAVKATDMEEVLDESGPFTVFAPLDSAFSKFSQTKLEELFNSEDKTELQSLLKYHIVAGNFTAAEILRAMCRGEGKATFTTIQGNKITATMNGVDIILTDSLGNSARIISADSTQANGVIHEIDNVILPNRI